MVLRYKINIKERKIPDALAKSPNAEVK